MHHLFQAFRAYGWMQNFPTVYELEGDNRELKILAERESQGIDVFPPSGHDLSAEEYPQSFDLPSGARYSRILKR